MIITDMEGISGVDRMSMITERESKGFRIACERLMLDTNAAVTGAFDGGADEVYVVDGHGGGNNFIKGMLNPRARQVTERPWPRDLMETIDACMEVGLHAMAGTINGFLDHTQSSASWYNYYINGRRCGELAQGAVYAGIYDIPFVMVSGDEAACVEARQFLGNIECAVVKYGIGRNRARLVDPDESLIRIHDAARDSLKLVGKIKPYKPILPMEIKLELYRSDMCDALMERCRDIERLDARTVRKVVTQIEKYRDILF